MPVGRKTGGRVKGTPNKSTMDIGRHCRALVEDVTYRKAFKARLLAGTIPPAIEAMTWHYAYGKPQERLELSGDTALTIRWQS